ncbi:MAG: UdgX family uracil-DNA binding protein [Bradyrhizobium sp.]|uniref:UdgX family uracil-DNA binding protein n=1 Tax=Bradyrhizobium sp. TaxID=376 RepID=UPI0025C50B1B|nr:UdgX family uracil-DNA binding protein [Bradyrhizobium sp.]MBI5261967.1 UdgX family uracil-DNA binding protein [Bradyrhizobium sp.]
MPLITLDSQTDFGTWRKAARALALDNVPPTDVTWTVQGRAPGPSASPAPVPPETGEGTFNVSAKFVELAQAAILHRDPDRFAVLYRLLWRLKVDRDLLEIATDPDVSQVTAMAKTVHRDAHRMQAMVRFREIGRDRKSHYVAWFEPEHHIVEFTAPFFARRFADMPWSILTPDVCVHWDGHVISFTPGISKAEAEIRRGYIQPAGPRTNATLAEAPQRQWRNPAEASILEPLLADAARWTGAGITMKAGAELKVRQEDSMRRKAEAYDLEVLREEAATCRACHLYKDATQTVFGEGPQNASIMLVGEQPGDKEDLSGKPFVGPAGLMLDRALEEAGVDRKKVYVTNAVKHFKFVPRGKIRLHQKPNTPEIKACRQWYERELAAIRPSLVVAMGATAAQCVFGKITPINKNRGRLIDLDEGVKALVTVHPSYLLRLPDPESKELEYKRFVDDLKIAAGLQKKSARAA